VKEPPPSSPHINTFWDIPRETAVQSMHIFPSHRWLLGGVLSENAEALARVLFRDVVVTQDAAVGERNVHATLTPVVTALRYSEPRRAFAEALVTVEIAWAIRNRAGETVWQDRVVGAANGRWGDGFGWNSGTRTSGASSRRP